VSPTPRQNLKRLLEPRHVAVIGGHEAEVVAVECARIGYRGKLWSVNPRRPSIGGHRCFARVEDLPEPPDACFVAVPREVAIETVKRLADMGAGGAVCYTAGFGETGPEGAALEAKLVEAAGDLALVGPNCYGVINYLGRVALWPFAHGGSCPGYGAAIITQSGMLSSDLTMSQRSVPFAFMVAAGNQSVVTLEDFIDVLSGYPGVRAIGLHIEGIRDLARFCKAALAALDANVPVVAFKTGTSKIGATLTVSHTGSLSGTDDLYQALFDRLGIIRVNTPAQMLETLKFLCIAGVPRGNRIMGLTCSGGSATMLADHAEVTGLTFPQPTEGTAKRLSQQLPHTATVSNPLDYTTPIWGHPERIRPVFQTMLGDPYDAAVIVQDYPLSALDESKPSYLNDAKMFIETTRAAGVPAGVCSILPENIDRDTREMLATNGVVPMQGLQEALIALAGAAWYGCHRHRVRLDGFEPVPLPPPGGGIQLIDEQQGKRRLAAAGIDTPEGASASTRTAPDVAAKIGFPVAVKMLSEHLPHKTEAGALALGLTSRAEVRAAVARIREAVGHHDSDALSEHFLVEKMIDTPLAELLVNVRADPPFGFAMTLASGGILAELVGDAVTVLLPATGADLGTALARLRIARLLEGYRSGPRIDPTPIIETLSRLTDYVLEHPREIVEIEINPLFVLPDRVCAVDALVRVRTQAAA
jgi:acyl-CoA synthetase (NDP forming)